MSTDYPLSEFNFNEKKVMTIQDKLQAIDNCEVNVTDWECKFIESCIGKKLLTKKQCDIIKKMYKKYF